MTVAGYKVVGCVACDGAPCSCYKELCSYVDEKAQKKIVQVEDIVSYFIYNADKQS